MKTKMRLMIVLLFPALLLVGCGSTVPPGKMGLRWEPLSSGLGKEALKEGFYGHTPWNDVLLISVQWRNYSERIDVLTRDDLHIEIKAAVLVKPLVKELHALRLEIGADFYSSVVKPEFITVARNVLANYLLVKIPENSPEIERKIKEGLQERMKGKHIEIDNVTISDIDFTSGILRAIEIKLSKEQEKIQKNFELEIAVKDAEIARARAKGEADSLQIRAVGEAEAQKIRAAGQAESQRIIDLTLTTRFLQFKAFESPNTKFIYVPTGKDGLPIILNSEAGPVH
ncbi:hypothetical protein MNBD_NITROSPIRAE01-1017 [hydrothermal vent metagenome]|uniref:Band 7 domain-containing protein n=1 Tax=hydrothermal vent metagenome TaxID=652676 RepID=A0A3B1CTS8_9ZZZZ